MPTWVRRCWVRGCTGKMTGISAATASIAPRSRLSFSVESTFEGRWRVRTPKRCQPAPFFRASSSPIADCWAMEKVAQGIDHHVAYHENTAAGTSFFEEVLDGIFLGNEEVVGNRVG